MPPGYAKPQKQVLSKPTLVGKISFTIYTSKKGGDTCLLGFNSYPDSVFENQTKNQMLENGMQAAIKTGNGKLAKNTDFSFSGYPGRSFYVSGESNGSQFYARFDCFIIQPSLYQIGYVSMGSDKSTVEKPEINAFFDSFIYKNKLYYIPMVF